MMSTSHRAGSASDSGMPSAELDSRIAAWKSARAVWKDTEQNGNLSDSGAEVSAHDAALLDLVNQACFTLADVRRKALFFLENDFLALAAGDHACALLATFAGYHGDAE
jgi:hypothetical protein